MRSALMIAAFTASVLTAASAHESWISQGQYRNRAGEFCCGDNDCEVKPAVSWALGWIIDGEKYRYEEFTPSPDGQVWVCGHRTDGKFDMPFRCKFAPPPSD